MQEQECYPNNTFSDSIPDIDTCCGCIEDYDLTDWNDTEPIDGEDGSFNPMPDERRHGEPCIYDYPECQSCARQNKEVKIRKESNASFTKSKNAHIIQISADKERASTAQTHEIQPESNTYKIIDI